MEEANTVVEEAQAEAEENDHKDIPPPAKALQHAVDVVKIFAEREAMLRKSYESMAGKQVAIPTRRGWDGDLPGLFHIANQPNHEYQKCP